MCICVSVAALPTVSGTDALVYSIPEGIKMAGSRKWFEYTTNAGGVFGINIDESNSEAVNAAGDYGAASTVQNALPRNISPRAGIYQSADGNRTIRCFVLTAAAYNTLLADFPTIDDPLNTGNTLTLVRLEPETFTILPIAVDTGLNDGDAT